MWSSRRFRLLAAIAGAALVAAAGLQIAVRLRGDAPLSGPVADPTWRARGRACFESSGFHPPQMSEGSLFSWSEERASLRFPALVRSVPYRLELRLRAPRSARRPDAQVALSIDGEVRGTETLDNRWRTLRLEVPPDDRRGMTVGIQLSDSLARGVKSPRSLGAQVENVSLAPLGAAIPAPPPVLAALALATAAYGLGAALCGAGALAALLVAFFAALLLAQLLLVDGAFVGRHAGSQLLCAAFALAACGLVRFVSGRLRSQAFPEWPAAAGLAVGAFCLKLTLALHPAALVGDALFQVHRAEWVLEGKLFFTSVTPKPGFEFPYPIGLYVSAIPFWSLLPDHVLLLRALTLGAESLAAFGLYLVVRRVWGDVFTALAATALFPLVPIGTQTFTIGNLSNNFGQAVFALALISLVACSQRSRRLVWIGAAGLLSLSFLSHFSTFLIGVVLVPVFALVLPRGSWARARPVLAAFLLALGLSYTFYYARFHDVYRATLERVWSGEGRDLERSITSPPAEKLPALARFVRDSYGIPLLLGAATGLVVLARAPSKDPLTGAVLAGLITVCGFGVLGLLTPAELRATLAGQPVIAVLATLGLSAAARGRLPSRLVSAALAVATAGHGLSVWIEAVAPP